MECSVLDRSLTRCHLPKTGIIALLLSINLLSALNFRQVAYIPRGIVWSYGYIMGLDINRNGFNDLVFMTTSIESGGFGNPHVLPGTFVGGIVYYEYQPYNRYIFRDSLSNVGTCWDIGDLDGDSLYDLVDHDLWDTLAIYEQESLGVYPKKKVWKYGFPPQCYNLQPMYITDLDKDGKREILCGDELYLYIFENNGNNQYRIAYFDSTPLSRDKLSFAVDDFDNDGRTEFIASSLFNPPNVLVYECYGDDQYRYVGPESVPWPNNDDAIALGDLDEDGKGEFLIGGCYAGVRFANLMAIFESVSDNDFVKTFMDSVETNYDAMGFHSAVGDVDSDGKNELVWAICSDWMIYRAVGNNQYQRIYSQYNGNNGHNCTNIQIYDLNKNGYPEIIESGGNETHIFEIEGVRLHRPNGGEILQPGSQFPITWEKFTPPGADSFSLFVSYDNALTFDTITTGLTSNDTMFLWTIPDTGADSCKIMIWAYGPPRPGQNVPRGTAWDFSDSTFSIRQTVVAEGTGSMAQGTGLRILQNPTTARQGVTLLATSHTPHARLQIYDVVGSLVRSFTMTNNESPITLLWNVCDDHGASLPEGVYFVRLESAGSVITRKVVVLE